ncbi:hypothetical protein PsorP6_011005 [Peronosclerospora sorghi]|uniref:Uncharacterized protein n=1 Tax=Peronosclerospora sorghi TaxID=230839 RepID=A0ACC0VTS7_9STRA|nr:hypothetical protein PsorP6_011005 [Peronosclerospora sorghi]
MLRLDKLVRDTMYAINELVIEYEASCALLDVLSPERRQETIIQVYNKWKRFSYNAYFEYPNRSFGPIKSYSSCFSGSEDKEASKIT